MHRQFLISSIYKYLKSPLCHDRKMAQKFIEFINMYKNCFERSLEIGHITASCLLLNPQKTHALFTLHKKLKKWLQLGGHADGDNNTLNVALKEAAEESGISGIKPLSLDILDLDIHKIPAYKDQKAHLHYDVRYALVTLENTSFVISDESEDLKWVSLSEFEKFSLEDSIVRLREKFVKSFLATP